VKHRSPNPLRLLALLLLLAVPLVTTGCGSDSADSASGATSPKDVTLRVGVQKDGVRSILAASGQLSKMPYKVSFSTFAFGPPLVEAAGADKIDVAGVGSTPPIFGAAAGSKFKVIASIEKRNHTDDALLVPKGSPVRSFADLKGKKIAIAKGSSANGYILQVLRRLHLTQNDVQLVYLAPADALAAFSSGRVDAWAVWQPFVAQALAGGARVVMSGPPDEAGSSFEIASTKALDDPVRRKALSDFIVRLQKAYAWAAANPDKWAAAWSQESQLPESTTKPAVRGVIADVKPVPAAVIAKQQQLANVLSDEKVIPSKVDFKSIIDPGVLK
jgi:sulfonate transport system substrate-binding protein